MLKSTNKSTIDVQSEPFSRFQIITSWLLNQTIQLMIQLKFPLASKLRTIGLMSPEASNLAALLLQLTPEEKVRGIRNVLRTA
jgi:hypothetical protein